MTTLTAAPVSTQTQKLEAFAVAAAEFQGAWPSVSDAFRLEMFDEFLYFYELGHSYESAPHWWAKDAELAPLYESIACFVDNRDEVLEAWTDEETQRIVNAVDVVRRQLALAATYVRATPGTAFHLAVWAVLSGGTFPAYGN